MDSLPISTPVCLAIEAVMVERTAMLTLHEAERSSQLLCSMLVGKSSSPLYSIPYSTGLTQNGRRCPKKRRRKPRPSTTLTSRWCFSHFHSQPKKSSNHHIEVLTQSGKHSSKSARIRSSFRRSRVSGTSLRIYMF